jgi:hypothetical protein
MNHAEIPAGGAAARGRSTGPLTALLNLFSNVWFGVALLVLLFVYCSIGSAVPSLRENALLDMTEFEWFHWWPFDVLVVLFSVALAVVTIRRIPLRLVNAGVWTIHTGIIMMVLGSYIYFGTKVEGDAPVFRRHVKIQVPGVETPATLLCSPGAFTEIGNKPNVWRFEIQETKTDWPILSGDDKGKRAYSANVLVRKPSGETFIRQLLDGYPQYTEDLVFSRENPAPQRAKNVLGRPLVDEELGLALELEPQKYFHVMQTWALFVRRVGDTEWHERPIRRMPRYNDRIRFADQVFATHPMTPNPIDIEVPAAGEQDPLRAASVRVKGYLRYAQLIQRWSEGPELNPLLQFSASSKEGRATYPELLAFDPQRNHTEDANVEFVFLADAKQLETYPRDARAILRIELPTAGQSVDVPLGGGTIVGDQGSFTPIEGTDFAYRIRQVAGGLQFEDGPVSIAIVDVKTPDKTFTRMVADNPRRTVDMLDAADPHGGHGRMSRELDPRFVMTYRPASSPVSFLATPDGRLHLSYNGDFAPHYVREVFVGQPTQVVSDITLTVDRFLMKAVSEVKPQVVPPAQRRRDVAEQMSMILLEVETSAGAQSVWVPFNSYVFPNEQYGMGTRFVYTPVRFAMPDGRAVEVVFSRERRELPDPIALDDFHLRTHIGGYAGRADTILNYVSELRFQQDGGWSDQTPIMVNEPTENGGFWYFQSMWDPPAQGPGTGMNFTGLGVGNRNGVYVQLAGCTISVAGMIFAFYVKPIIRRRRQEKSWAKAAGRTGADRPEEAMVLAD